MIIELEQGSEAWKAYRRSHITATDAAIITGMSTFKPLKQLWEEKLLLREPDPMNEAMRRGNLLEPEARALFNEMYPSMNMEPVVLVSDKLLWQMASLDGMCLRDPRFILEIKCPGKNTHEKAIRGEVPDYYISQIQHQFSVSGAEKCYYMTYLPTHDQKSAIVEVWRDDKYIAWQNAIEQDFYENHMCLMIAPQEPWKLKLREIA